MVVGAWVALAEEEASAQGPASAELKELHDADQADRSFTKPPSPDHWKGIAERDKKRRDRVMELIKAGSLETADDYYHAAMVLQHGEGSEDILIAHILSTVAGFKGHETGQWLSAAALDRYLHRIDQPQRLGTQYLRSGPDVPWSQDPYEDWLPDSVRAAYGVPTLESQQQRVEQMNQRDR
ncbi:hypothetical protein ABI59_20660 [Acidobacteria bacterium Mor1]|nr:hypothetical protein ABI59_20660 [Acidobacteria bacterium Mor1]